MAFEVMVDPETLRVQVKEKYREVALNPRGSFHFHTGRPLAVRLGYDESVIASFPESAVEAFAGVANPFSLRSLSEGERVVDLGSGEVRLFRGFPAGWPPRTCRRCGHDARDAPKGPWGSVGNGSEPCGVSGRVDGDLPVGDGWADVVISNGVINLCADKRRIFSEIDRVLRPGGRIQFADIAHGKPVPEEVIRNIDLWTG